MQEPRHLDALDRSLIAYLRENARHSATDLAKKLSVARSTVHERIARLERDGVIVGYTTVVRRDPTEELTQAILFAAVEQRRIERAVHRLEFFHEVKSCASICGEFDLFCLLEAPRLEDLDVVLDEISQIPEITRIASTVIYANKFDRIALPAVVAAQQKREVGRLVAQEA